MGSSHEVVDLALSDEEEGCPAVTSASTATKRPMTCLQSPKHHHHNIEDLTHDLLEIPPPTEASPATTTNPAIDSTTWPGFLSDGTNTRGDGVFSNGALGALEAPSVPCDTVLPPRSPATPPAADRTAAGSASADTTADTGAARCASCSSQDVPRRHAFNLEHCGHSLCPACMALKVTEAETDAPACPVLGCSAAVSVRDLALVLPEQAWDALQTRRLAAFRCRSRMGNIPCCGCSVRVESATRVTEGVVVVGGRWGAARGRTGGGTVRQRAQGLLGMTPLVCEGCRNRRCWFCGARATARSMAGSARSACGCGGRKLWSAAGLLELLEELVANPADVTLSGPVGPLVPPAGAAGVGGRYGSKGRGHYFHSGAGRGGSSRGRGRGRGGWAAYFLDVGMGFGMTNQGGRGGSKGISSKWSKGTGFGGGGDEGAAAYAQAVAQETEGRADRAMAVVFDALAACLPARGQYPEHMPEMVALVRESSLLQVVCAYLRNDSLMDIAKRREIYQVGLGDPKTYCTWLVLQYS